MPLARETIESLIREAFPDAAIELADLAGDDDHWHLTVTSQVFAGKPRIAQHKLVYTALKGYMATTLHALQITTRTPD